MAPGLMSRLGAMRNDNNRHGVVMIPDVGMGFSLCGRMRGRGDGRRRAGAGIHLEGAHDVATRDMADTRQANGAGEGTEESTSTGVIFERHVFVCTGGDWCAER